MQIPSKLLPLFETPNIHNIISGGRGGAKSMTVASLIVEAMAKTPLNIICAREVQKSLKDSSFAMIRDEIYRKGYGDLFTINPSRGEITRGKARAVFIGLKEHTVDSIKSYTGFHWVWIEEAHSVSKRSLEVLIPTLRIDGQFKLVIADRTFIFPLRMFLYSLNPFTWDDPINHVLPETRTDVTRITINYYDNPWFPVVLEEERKQAKKSMSDDEYNRIWEGIPFEDAERAIMSRADIGKAMKRKVSLDGGLVIGADIARFGQDRTVFVKRRGLQLIDYKILQGKDTQEVARRLFDYAEGGKINVDDTGIGGGVTDKLKDLGANVYPINFGWAAVNKKKYPDVISEMWFCLAEQINEIGLIDNLELLSELASRHYSYTKDERRKVESKEEYKKRTGRRSPDLADALIMCYYTGRRPIKVVRW